MDSSSQELRSKLSRRREELKSCLFNRTRPPRLEDAGLEDSALSPDSIREAFFKAASAVRCRSYFDDDDDDDDDDVVIGGMNVRRGKSCVIGLSPKQEDELEAMKRRMKKSYAEERRIWGLEGGSRKSCVVDGVIPGMEEEVEAVKRLMSGRKKSDKEEKPILAEGFP